MKRQILNDVFARKPPAVLYHYTTQKGLLGILKDREIWATHTQYLSDQREYLHAQELVTNEIDAAIANPQGVGQEQLLQVMKDRIKGIQSINVCVCSFSEVPDSLSQWRAYSDATSGFAIGFLGSFLAKATAKQNFYLGKCLYTSDEQRTLVRALIQEVLEGEESSPDPEEYWLTGGYLPAYLNRYGTIIKDPAFSDEKEWRVISRPSSCRNERFRFRPGKSTLIPYYCFPLSGDGLQFNVHDIVVGPTIHSRQALRAVESLLIQHGLRNVLVINSKVPYRNW